MGLKAFSSHHPSSEIGNASNTFMFCVFRAFRGPLFRNLGSPAQPDSGLRCHSGSGATAPFRESSSNRFQSRARPQFDVGGLPSIRRSLRRCCGTDELSNGLCIGFLAPPPKRAVLGGPRTLPSVANISQRSHPSINHSLFDWRMISRTISIGMHLVHRRKMEGESRRHFLDFAFSSQHSCRSPLAAISRSISSRCVLA
jgi:hypothetical protein